VRDSFKSFSKITSLFHGIACNWCRREDSVRKNIYAGAPRRRNPCGLFSSSRQFLLRVSVKEQFIK
jgi:hypothetical protein